VGLDNGFQWIDGSFVEDVEKSRGRAPGDVDIVTFAHRPASVADFKAFLNQNSMLFDPAQAKQ
jgi:hypothetical protein